MKKITFRKDPNDEKHIEGVLRICSQVMGNSPHKSLTVDEMRKRVRVQDAIDNADDNVIHLEDSDYATLKEGVNSFPWNQASRALVNLIDDIEAAESISFLKVVKNENKEPSETEEAASASA